MATAVDLEQRSLYAFLAEEAPESAGPSETSITRAKETVDDDREVVWLGDVGEI
jgi:hypothetical protein